MEIKISNVFKHDKGYDIEVNNGEINYFIPIRGNSIDLIRAKVQINIPKKYTALDIHIIQEKVFRMLVDTDYKEVE